MTHFLDQAPEVLHLIFRNVEPTDLASLSQTCQYLYKLIKTDELLWRYNYLSQFDPPTESEPQSWRERVIRLVRVQKILESNDDDIKVAALEEVLTASIELAYQSQASSRKITDFLASLFEKPSNIGTFLCRSSLFALAKPESWTAAPSETLRQLSAQLHVLAGMNLEPQWPIPDHEFTCPRLRDEDSNSIRGQPIRHVHPYARSRVYDLRRYREANMWGPFMDDGSQRVDWEKVQAIMVILAYNHRIYTERRGLGVPLSASMLGASASIFTTNPRSGSRSGSVLRPWEDPFSGIAAHSFLSAPLAGTPVPALRPDLDALDPYGVTGTWIRIVCFLDYNDLYAFNFESGDLPADQERDPITTREAFRLIRLQLKVKAIEDPGEEDGKDLPVVHFEGTSRSTFMAWDPNANSRIRGTVRQTPGGAIRWTTFSIFHGEERWRSEGVQIGGLKSARGILGNWFDKNYDVHGPAGPTAFWKISDEMVEEKRPASNLVHVYVG